MLTIHTYDEQVRRFGAAVDAHAIGGRTIAENAVDNSNALHLCRRRLSLVQALSQDLSDDLKRLDRVLTALEHERPDVDEAARLLADDEWSNLVVPGCFAGVPCYGFQQTFSDEDLLLALLPSNELASVRSHLARPTFQRLRWSKGDYLVVGACVIIGLAIELVNTAWKVNSPIDPEGHIRKWFDKELHIHEPRNPIDYQGTGFGGGFHRARSRGHDLARFLEAVRQTADGEFRGRRWAYGKPIEVITRINQYGNQYPEMDWFAAFVNVTTHLFADFFSSYSLPLPLTSVVYDFCGREFRKFVVDLYENGFHLRHVTAGATQVLLAYLGIEVWLWLQNGIDARQTESVSLKRAEMRASSMALLSGANLAGCALIQNPFNLNIPTLIAAVDSAVHLWKLNRQQNFWMYKEARNFDELVKAWIQTEATVTRPM